jgi:flavin reductase (DIM6/NTAB) family NADH-FMN oxidoreductase RutF
MESERDSTDAAVDDFLASLNYPLLVVTTANSQTRAGCLVGFATQCSVEPLLLLVCVSDKNRTCRVAEDAEGLAIHAISENERDLAELFGGETGDEIDKFEHCEWSAGPLNLPILDRAAGWIAATIEGRFEAGDHVAHLVQPVEAELRRSFEPLRTRSGAEIDPGHDA